MGREEAITLLGLKEPLNMKDLKKVYKSKSKENHPDMPNGSKEKFQKIVESYNLLRLEVKDMESRVYTHLSIMDIALKK